MRLLVLAGDGIGPEITAAALEVLEAAGARHALELELEHEEIGFASLERHGTTLRDAVLDRALRCDGVLLGPQGHADYPPRSEGGINVSAAFRVRLDLYANIRPARTRPFLPAAGRSMDLVIVREATEGFYADRNMFAGSGEFMPEPGVALGVRKITTRACRRIARRAFDLAMERRRHVTAVHKANNLKLTDGLFMDAVRATAGDYPDVVVDDVLVDAMAAHLVRDASRYDVVVTTNLYGDILSDLAVELSGSIGLGGALMAGDDLAAAQAQHGSAPDIAGTDRANPSSMILSVAMLLGWLGRRRGEASVIAAGRAMEEAVDAVLSDPGSRTADLGGDVGTRAFGAAVARRVAG